MDCAWHVIGREGKRRSCNIIGWLVEGRRHSLIVIGWLAGGMTRSLTVIGWLTREMRQSFNCDWLPHRGDDA